VPWRTVPGGLSSLCSFFRSGIAVALYDFARRAVFVLAFVCFFYCRWLLLFVRFAPFVCFDFFAWEVESLDLFLRPAIFFGVHGTRL